MARNRGLLIRLLRWGRNILGVLVAAYVVALAAFELREREPAFESIPDNPFSVDMPRRFLWGAATSAHQIEGGNLHNDWARFETDPINSCWTTSSGPRGMARGSGCTPSILRASSAARGPERRSSLGSRDCLVLDKRSPILRNDGPTKETGESCTGAQGVEPRVCSCSRTWVCAFRFRPLLPRTHRQDPKSHLRTCSRP